MTCCFIGHRRIEQTPELKELLAQTICSLIELGVTDFIFGDHSAFDTLCYGTISALQENTRKSDGFISARIIRKLVKVKDNSLLKDMRIVYVQTG